MKNLRHRMILRITGRKKNPKRRRKI